MPQNQHGTVFGPLFNRTAILLMAPWCFVGFPVSLGMGQKPHRPLNLPAVGSQQGLTGSSSSKGRVSPGGSGNRVDCSQFPEVLRLGVSHLLLSL